LAQKKPTSVPSPNPNNFLDDITDDIVDDEPSFVPRSRAPIGPEDRTNLVPVNRVGSPFFKIFAFDHFNRVQSECYDSLIGLGTSRACSC
jgi:hypothetical protein